MSGTFNITVKVTGLKELLRVIDPPTNLYGEPWKAGMVSLAQRGESLEKATAPYRTGYLQRHIKGVVQKSPLPKWVAIRSRGVSQQAKYGKTGRRLKATKILRTAKYPKGFPYPRLLEFSPKHHHQGWFSNVRGAIASGLDATLSQISTGIIRKWVGR